MIESALMMDVNTLNQTTVVLEHALVKDFIGLIKKLTENNLMKYGLASRFFLLLGFPLDQYFIPKRELSLIQLIETFFFKLKIGISIKILSLIEEDLFSKIKGEESFDYDEDIDLFTFYLIIFIVNHISRYKIYTWQKLVNSDLYKTGFYLKYIIVKILDLYIRKIFSVLEFITIK